MNDPQREPAARPRIAYLSFSTGEYDARTFRMAKSAVAAGWDVTVYARWHRASPRSRSATATGWSGRRATGAISCRVCAASRGAVRRDMADAARVHAARQREPGGGEKARATVAATTLDPKRRCRLDARPGQLRRGAGPTALRRDGRPLPPPSRPRRPVAPAPVRALSQRVVHTRSVSPVESPASGPLALVPLRASRFPLRPMGWAVALDDVAEPADIWHGMWAGSLPALARMRRRHGGRTIYDSRDVFMHSRQYARLGRPGRNLLEWAERRWARGADRVLTVNDAYAELLQKQLRVARPPVVMNCREIWTPPSPRPDLIREALGLPAETAVVLYQGILTMERGIEQSMEAILQVPSAVLVLMGFGMLEESLAEQVSRPPYLGRVLLLPPVPPEDLLVWSASADVLVMAIQPTTLNHRYTTPQKLFESMAAGVPVVASDLPGMAPIVRATGAASSATRPHRPRSPPRSAASSIGRPPIGRRFGPASSTSPAGPRDWRHGR